MVTVIGTAVCLLVTLEWGNVKKTGHQACGTHFFVLKCCVQPPHTHTNHFSPLYSKIKV